MKKILSVSNYCNYCGNCAIFKPVLPDYGKMTIAVCLCGNSTDIPKIIKRENYKDDIGAIEIPVWCPLEDYNESKT